MNTGEQEMSDQITYEEAATILGLVPGSIYQLVSEGRLHSIKTPGTNKKKLGRAEVEAYGNRVPYYQAPPATSNTNAPLSALSETPVTPQALPATSVQDVLRLVNEGFSHISSDHEKIAERYKETVSPIINHVISPPEQLFIAELSRMMQTLLNNSIMMIKTPNISAATPKTVVDMLLRGMDLPTQLKDMLRSFAIQLTQMSLSEQEAMIAA
jgi:excisionase family DNA binding protein